MPVPIAFLRGVSRRFPGGNGGLAETDLDLAPGEMVALLGPSGCGKSTLLRLLGGLDQPDSGTVSVLGGKAADTTATAFILQDPALLPWLSVRHNAALLLKLRGKDKPTRLSEADKWLARLGLTDKADRFPWSLSGGERMRVSLARALGLSPRLFLFDEPFAALDEISRESLQEELRALQRLEGWTGVFVTHSAPEAAFLADRVVILEGRPGRVKQIVPVALPSLREASLRCSPEFATAVALIREALRA